MRHAEAEGERPGAEWACAVSLMFIFDHLSRSASGGTLRHVTGDAEVLDAVERDADRVVLCRCGGAGRVVHASVSAPGEPERYVRATFTCTWDRSGPHEPLLPPRRAQL